MGKLPKEISDFIDAINSANSFNSVENGLPKQISKGYIHYNPNREEDKPGSFRVDIGYKVKEGKEEWQFYHFSGKEFMPVLNRLISDGNAYVARVPGFISHHQDLPTSGQRINTLGVVEMDITMELAPESHVFQRLIFDESRKPHNTPENLDTALRYLKDTSKQPYQKPVVTKIVFGEKFKIDE